MNRVIIGSGIDTHPYMHVRGLCGEYAGDCGCSIKLAPDFLYQQPTCRFRTLELQFDGERQITAVTPGEELEANMLELCKSSWFATLQKSD